ncbi:MAG TPA: amino acid permease [Candidatus Acidoferrales bacterium]
MTTLGQGGQHPTLAREIGLKDGIALVVGGIIGSGIFLVPNEVSQRLDSFGAVILVWVFGGLLSLAGALSLGELGAAMPSTGGLYVYLREAYGRPLAFLYGWALFTMIHTGTIAALGAALGLYASQLMPLGDVGQKAVGVGSIALLTWVNCMGLGPGKWVQNVFTVAKVAGLGLVIVLLLMRGKPIELLATEFWPADGFSFAVVPFGLALVAVLWAYEGWHTITFSAGEFRNPVRDLPRSLAIGTLAIVIIYLFANWGYYAVLPGAEIAQTGTVAATAMTNTWGTWAGVFMSVLILVSIFGANNATVLLGPRLFYAMAREGLFFPAVGRVHPKYRVPVTSVIVQGVWASLLVISGTFLELINNVVFTHWIFYALAVAGVIVLRKKQPDLPRPYKLPGYPVLPVLFVLAAAGLTINVFMEFNWKQLIGIAIVLAGIPMYFVFQRFFKPMHDSDQ